MAFIKASRSRTRPNLRVGSLNGGAMTAGPLGRMRAHRPAAERDEHAKHCRRAGQHVAGAQRRIKRRAKVLSSSSRTAAIERDRLKRRSRPPARMIEVARDPSRFLDLSEKAGVGQSGSRSRRFRRQGPPLDIDGGRRAQQRPRWPPFIGARGELDRNSGRRRLRPLEASRR